MTPLKLLRRLRVDIEELEIAFESHDLEMSWYLDIETGRTVLITDEEVRHARNLDVDPAGGEESDEVARQVLAGLGCRYVPTPQDDPSDAWTDMSAFIEELEEEALKVRMRAAIRGKGAIHRFRLALREVTELEEDWYLFQQQRLRARIVEWLASLGIAGFYEPD